MTRHNKKRNAGLMYEFLIRSISRFLVEGNNENAEITKKIIKKYYNSNTELHKEYRLINALVNVPVGSDTVATAVLQEARSAATRFDSKALKIEKGNMIKVCKSMGISRSRVYQIMQKHQIHAADYRE